MDQSRDGSVSVGRRTRVARSRARRILAIGLGLVALIAAPVPSATSAAGPPDHVAVRDGFSRMATAGWGSTPTGGAYSVTGTPADFAVDGSVGSIVLPRAGSTRIAVLPAVSIRDVDATVRVRVDRPATGTGQFIQLIGRWAGEEDGYRVGIRIASDGSVHELVTRLAGGDKRSLGADALVPGVSVASPTYLWLRAQILDVAPTVLRLKAWPDGALQPDEWAAEYVDPNPGLVSPGAVGIFSYLSGSASNAPVRMSFDDLAVDSVDPVPAGAYVISTAGSDSASGLVGSPWRTLQKAVDTVPAGATVLVRSGTYTGFVMRRSGNSGAPIVIRAYPGDARPVISGDAATVNVIRLSGVHDVQLADLVVQGAAADKNGAAVRIENGATRISLSGSLLRDNRGYGISINSSTYVTVSDNEVTRNAEGIYVSRAGEGVLIEGNRVHDQDHLVVNTSDVANDDHGAVGIAFVKTTGHIVARDNQLWRNRAPSYDYGWDGGAFEIFGASNVSMLDNRMWDNKNVLETGTDGELPCAHNVFARNVAYGATSAGDSVGLMLRCDQDDLIANNTLYDLDGWMFTLNEKGGSFAGSLAGLTITNNILCMDNGKVYAFMSSLPSSVDIDRNLLYQSGGGTTLAYVVGKGSTASLAQLTAWTGFEATGLDGDPLFQDAAGHDLDLRAGSPAVDRGRLLGSLTAGYAGAAPDLGSSEYGH